MAINLIPQKETSGESSKLDLRFYVLISVILLLSVSLLLGGKYFYNNYKLNLLEDEESVVIKDENSLSEFKESLSRYKNHPALTVLASHVYYSKLLETIEKNTPPNVKYSSFETDSDSNIRVSCTLMGSYRDAASFMKILKKAGFQEVAISTLSTPEDKAEVAFQLTFKFVNDMVVKK